MRFGRSFPVPDPTRFQSVVSGAQTYYVSSTGSDSNNGLSPSTPWQTITKVNAHTFVPGDTILFNGGNTFSGAIYSSTISGNSANSITFGSYGTGNATITSSSFAFYFYDAGGIIIENLTTTGSSALNAGDGGIFFYADNAQYSNIQISNCTVSGFTDGILIEGYSIGGYNNVTISNCITYGNRDNGILFAGPAFTGSNWAHTNVTITGCGAYNNLGYASNTTSWSGSGITVGSVNGGTMSLCYAYGNGTNNSYTGGGPVGLWTYESNNFVISNCVAYNNQSGTGADGDGFDIDLDCTNCTIEYCLSYGNYGAGILIYGTNSTWSTNTVCYNICYGNGQNPSGGYGAEIAVPGITNSLKCYNNTLVATGSNTPLYLAGTHTTDSFWNNILNATSGYSLNSTTAYTTSQVEMQGNDYWSNSGMSVEWSGTNYTTLSSWQSATSQELVSSSSSGLSVNPYFVSNTSPTVTNPSITTGVNGLELYSYSGLIGSGLNLSSLFSISVPSSDYFGNYLSSPYNIGAYAGSGVPGALGSATLSFSGSGSTFVVVPSSNSTISFTGSGNASSLLSSSGSSTLSFSGSGSSSYTQSTTGAGGLAFIGSGNTFVTVPINGNSNVSFNGSGSTSFIESTSGSASLNIAGSGSGNVVISIIGASTVSFSGSGNIASSSGSSILSITGSGSSSIISSGAGNGIVNFVGSGNTNLTLSILPPDTAYYDNATYDTATYDANGVTSNSTLSFSGSGSTSLQFPINAAGNLNFTGSGSTSLTLNTSGASSLLFTSSGSSSYIQSSSGNATISFISSGSAILGVSLIANATLTFISSGTSSVNTFSGANGIVSFITSAGLNLNVAFISNSTISFIGSGVASSGGTLAALGFLSFTGMGNVTYIQFGVGYGSVIFVSSGSSILTIAIVANSIVSFVGLGSLTGTLSAVGVGALLFTSIASLGLNSGGLGLLSFIGLRVASFSGAAFIQIIGVEQSSNTVLITVPLKKETIQVEFSTETTIIIDGIDLIAPSVNTGQNNPLIVTFVNNGQNVNLTGCTVRAMVQRPLQPNLYKTLNILSPPTNGQSELYWNENDLYVGIGESQVQYLINFTIIEPTTQEIQPPPLPVNVLASS